MWHSKLFRDCYNRWNFRYWNGSTRSLFRQTSVRKRRCHAHEFSQPQVSRMLSKYLNVASYYLISRKLSDERMMRLRSQYFRLIVFPKVCCLMECLGIKGHITLTIAANFVWLKLLYSIGRYLIISIGYETLNFLVLFFMMQAYWPKNDNASIIHFHG